MASLFLVASDLKRMLVWATVSEADIMLVKEGQDASFTVEAWPKKTFLGKVKQKRMNAAMTQGAVLFTVVVEVDNTEGLLFPYLTADVQITIGKRQDALLVPDAALRCQPRAEMLTEAARQILAKAGPGQQFVWVEDMDQARPVPVTTGLSDGRWTEIVKGELKTGQAVITGIKAPPSRQIGSFPRQSMRIETRVTSVALTADDVVAILRACPAVASAAPVVRARAQVTHERASWFPTTFYGTTPDYLDVREWQDLAEGHVFSDQDVRRGAPVCLLGTTVAKALFQERSPVGKQVRVGGVALEVVGVLGHKGRNEFGSDQDDVVLAPWPTIKRIAVHKDNGKDTARPIRGVDMIYACATSEKTVADARQQITDVLRQRRRLTARQPDNFQIGDWLWAR